MQKFRGQKLMHWKPRWRDGWMIGQMERRKDRLMNGWIAWQINRW